MVKKNKIIKAPPTLQNNNHDDNKLSLTLYWTTKFVLSLVILYIAYKFARKITNLIINQIKRNISEHKKIIIHQLSDIIFYIVFGIGVLVALINLGVQTATIITLLGTMMVTIGFALQSILSNIFSGVSIALSDNFRIGDSIRIFAPYFQGNIEGEVRDLNITYVILKEKNTHKIIYVPNATVASNVIVNLSRDNIQQQEY